PAALSYPSHRPRPRTTLFPYTTLFRSEGQSQPVGIECRRVPSGPRRRPCRPRSPRMRRLPAFRGQVDILGADETDARDGDLAVRSEEHTSELQSRENLVCRLLLEKKKN